MLECTRTLEHFLQPFLAWILNVHIIQNWFICIPSESTVLEDAGIDMAVATMALTVKRTNRLAKSHPQLGYRYHPQLG